MAHRYSKGTHEAAAVSQSGTVDPACTDVTDFAGKRRKLRNRDDPRPELAEAKADLLKRCRARPIPPVTMLEPAGMDEEHWTADHNDRDLWFYQMADALGTRSHAVVTAFISQLTELCGSNVWDEEVRQWRIDENTLNAMLAMVNSIRPRNEMEAALAAQMVAVHWMQMRCSARALRWEHETKTVAVASKLARTFTMQLQELRGLRGRTRTTRQSIKVSRETHHHQHIHVHRGAEENDGQPHEQPREGCRNAPAADDACTALLSQEPGGQIVPLSSHARKGSLQAARG